MNTSRSKNVAIYARVSTTDQNPNLQLRELRQYARRRAFRVIEVVKEYESGAKADRDGVARIMDLARKRKIDAILVWKFDRFARSLKQLLLTLEECRTLGVDLLSYTQNIDTSTPEGKAFFSMVGVFAEFERDMLRQRVLAGMNRARAEGKQIGRAGLSRDVVGKMKRLRKKQGVRATARQLGVSPAVVSKYTSKAAR